MRAEDLSGTYSDTDALEQQRIISDLSLLVMRMARRLTLVATEGSVHLAGNKTLARQASDYLKRKQLVSPLRESPGIKQQASDEGGGG